MSPLTDPAWGIPLVLLFLYALAMLAFALGWIRTKQLPLSPGASVFVSVVIAARNEELRIAACIDSIARQDYPENLFEVIVVDDASTDRTAEVLQLASRLYPKLQLRVISLADISPNPSPKKRALQEGIAQSRGSLIVTTDADCSMHTGWLRSIVSCYRGSGAMMVVSPVALDPAGSWFQKMQALECMALVGSAGGSLGFQKPLMCNGANLAFEKKAFYDAGEYAGNNDLASGDDMFLMLDIHRRFPGKVIFNKDSEAIVYTPPCDTLKSFVAQRKRWASKSFRYNSTYVYAISLLVYFTNLSVAICLAFSIFYNRFVPLFAVLFLTKVLVDSILLIPVSRFFKNRELVSLLLPAQLVYAFYVSFSTAFAFNRGYRWKQRTLN